MLCTCLCQCYNEPWEGERDKRHWVRVNEKALNYRLRFCMMSIGLLTAHGDPHMFPLRTVILRSTEKQNPQLVGTLIFLSVYSLCTLVLTLLFSAAPLFSPSWFSSACGCGSHPCKARPASSPVSLCRAVRLSAASQEFSLPLAGVDSSFRTSGSGAGWLGRCSSCHHFLLACSFLLDLNEFGGFFLDSSCGSCSLFAPGQAI